MRISSAWIYRLVAMVVLFRFQSAFGVEPYEETLKHAQELPKLIQTCVIHSATYGQYPRQHVLLVDGKKFYSGSARTGEKDSVSYGYDGSSYWDRHLDRNRPSTAGYGSSSFFRVGMGQSNPLTSPYTWFWGDLRNVQWTDLQAPERWANVIARMEYLRTETVRKHTCDLFTIQYPELTKSYIVSFARELSGFPLRTELSINDKVFSVSEIGETYVHSSGAVIGLEFYVAKPGEDLSLERKIDSETLKINVPIDPTRFAFDATDMNIVVDVDAKETNKSQR